MTAAGGRRPSRLYALLANSLLLPLARWGRLSVHGLEMVPREGPVLIVVNHDSQIDPVVVGLALRRVRQLRFLTRADLWRKPLLGRPAWSPAHGHAPDSNRARRR